MNHSLAIFGEVLFDYFPDGQGLLGGAPFNVAWHCHALGQNSHFISRVGNDANGLSIQTAMSAWGMNIDDVQVDNTHSTGTVQVSFSEGQPHYAILPEQAYDFISAEQIKIQDYAVLYHGTLALRHAVSAQALHRLTQAHTGKIFVDMNLRAPWWTLASIEPCLQQAHWLKLNDEELRHWQTGTESQRDTLSRLLAQYQLDTIVLTCGALGAIALNHQGEWVEVTPEKTVNVVDTVGAGDAFSAVLLLGLQHNWSLAVSMQYAQLFASAIVEQRGAVVKDKAFYQPFLPLFNSNSQ